MLSTEDLERLITTKRREIEQEKTLLGLSEHNDVDQKDSETETKVAFRPRALSESNVLQNSTHEEEISPDLERYIRRYIGLPGMLKAGEFSPNNPLVREERAGGDVLRALGEYERRRNTLRKIRQRQYKEYLDQQAKKKQEAKEQAEREQRERDEKERLREEKERERRELREKSPEIRRRSVTVLTNDNYVTKVDTAVQVDDNTSPLSVAVQTDGRDIIWPRGVTPAERELSPRGASGQNHERNRLTSVFDEDAVRLRNLQAEKEALERRQYYQQELRNQIMEQQRIREERKNREKMLEQAEMRRLESQLQSLRVSQQYERRAHTDTHTAMRDNAVEYENKIANLQKEIEYEKNLLKMNRQSRSESPKVRYYKEDKPFSTNIPDNSIFSPKYDVDDYLRRNLNYKDTRSKESYRNERIENRKIDRNILTEQATVRKQKIDEKIDSLPIPVMRHSPKLPTDVRESSCMSEKMQIIDDKWKVPVVQKNILKSLNDKGKNVSILTQLGSIRRQLQLEQMKLDKLSEN